MTKKRYKPCSDSSNDVFEPVQSSYFVSRRVALGVALTVAVCLAVFGAVGCAPEESMSTKNSSAVEQENNYASGQGAVTEYAPDQRGEPVRFSGTTLEGKFLGSKNLLGSPAVVNFWYATCAPCRQEAPALEKAYKKYSNKNLQMVGVNVRDEKEGAEAFTRSFHVTYPSMLDKDGKILASLNEYVPAQAVPTTLFLDSKGRVSGRVLGRVDSSTLNSLIESSMKN